MWDLHRGQRCGHPQPPQAFHKGSLEKGCTPYALVSTWLPVEPIGWFHYTRCEYSRARWRSFDVVLALAGIPSAKHRRLNSFVVASVSQCLSPFWGRTINEKSEERSELLGGYRRVDFLWVEALVRKKEGKWHLTIGFLMFCTLAILCQCAQ